VLSQNRIEAFATRRRRLTEQEEVEFERFYQSDPLSL
jgi:hypothetical protein